MAGAVGTTLTSTSVPVARFQTVGTPAAAQSGTMMLVRRVRPSGLYATISNELRLASAGHSDWFSSGQWLRPAPRPGPSGMPRSVSSASCTIRFVCSAPTARCLA